MALIKCPECNKDVSTAADICPHCGFPIKNQKITKVNIPNKFEDYLEPKELSWTQKWKDKAKHVKIVWAVVFAACLFALFLSILAVVNNSTTASIVFTFLFGFLTTFALVFFIVAIASFNVRIRQYDGYTVLVYNGIKHLLVIEDEIQDSVVSNRFMYGHLPNKKQVWVSISSWDDSIKIGIGSEGDEKQIL